MCETYTRKLCFDRRRRCAASPPSPASASWSSQCKQQSLNGTARAGGKIRCKAIVGRAELAAGDRLQIMARWSRGGPPNPIRLVAQPPAFSSPLKQAQRSDLESENALQTKISNPPLHFSPGSGAFSDSLRRSGGGVAQCRIGVGTASRLRWGRVAVGWGRRPGRRGAALLAAAFLSLSFWGAGASLAVPAGS